MRKALLLAVLCAFLGTGIAQAQPLFLKVDGPAKAPQAWIEFCKLEKQDCNVPALEARSVPLTVDAFRQAEDINRHVNDLIKFRSDGKKDVWSYPVGGYGDCEDYVLLKRRMLIEAGWPRQTLLITVVRGKGKVGHAVLTWMTDKGEFIFDNEKDSVLSWKYSDLQFVMRQSQEDPNKWVYLADPRSNKVAAR